MKSNKLALTDDGKELIGSLKDDRRRAYDELFRRLIAKHLYVRDFIRAVERTDFIAPVISSMKDHIAARYSVTLSWPPTWRRKKSKRRRSTPDWPNG